MAKKQPRQGLRTEQRDNQISAVGGIQPFLLRHIPMWNPPAWQEADYWRKFVEKQPIAAICRDTLAMYLNSLDWSIVARDSEERDELKPRIKHYTKLFEQGNAYYWDIDFSTHVEWFIKDLFTLPFGTATELGRLDDNPKGKVVWIRPLDGGTLAPTLNFDYPVVQSALTSGISPIYFPREYIARVYLSPRTELAREGWGYAPPERIWRAIEMLAVGDSYYAQLLLNTPEAGILDLGDMEKTTALNWVNSMTDLLYGISPLKVPVLYEHTTDAKWIPFGKPPSEILYDSVTMKYAAVLAAGYGLTLSDIGFPSASGGGETLAGTIRMERVGKGSGKSLAKKKFEAYANRIVDPKLKFVFIDYDDERNVSKGRARLASAQASDILIRNKVFSPNEVRRQNIADGLISIDVPEEIDLDDPAFEQLQEAQPKQPFGGSKQKTLGDPTNPSQGGQGEVIPQQVIQRSMRDAEVGLAKAIYQSNGVLATLMETVSSNLSDGEMTVWNEYVDSYLIGKSDIEEDALKDVVNDVCQRARVVIETQNWAKSISEAIADKVLGVKSSQETSRAQMLHEQAEEESFISGEAGEGDSEIITVDLSAYREDLHGVIHESFASSLAKHCAMIAKPYILDGKLAVDSTERVGQNIRVSREVAADVLQNLSRIIGQVYETGLIYLDERIHNAGS